MKKTIIKTFITLSILSLCQSALAVNQAKDVSITLGGGYDYFASNRQVQNAGIPIGILGYNFTDHWGIEALISFFNTDSRQPAIYGKQVNGDIFAFDVVYHFSPYRFAQPYLLAGPGITGLNPNGNDAHQSGNFNGAAGVQLFMNDSVAFRFEARDLYTFVGGMNDVLLSGGITFLIAT